MMERYKLYRSYGHSRVISAMHAFPVEVVLFIGLVIGFSFL